MKQKNAVYMIVVTFLLCSSTCRKNKECSNGSHSKIDIKNNSSQLVNWIRDDHPNDSIWTVNGDYPGLSDNLISANSIYPVNAGTAQCFEHFYDGYSQYYFIFNHDTVQTIGWQNINGTNRGLLKRVKVDLDYLQNNNFTITYP